MLYSNSSLKCYVPGISRGVTIVQPVIPPQPHPQATGFVRVDVSRHQTLRDVATAIEERIRQLDNSPQFSEVVLFDQRYGGGGGGGGGELDMSMTVETSGLFGRRRYLELDLL